jgi:hypothetical protein
VTFPQPASGRSRTSFLVTKKSILDFSRKDLGYLASSLPVPFSWLYNRVGTHSAKPQALHWKQTLKGTVCVCVVGKALDRVDRHSE